MLIALPISELTPGMFVDSVTKQHEGLNSIKIKTSGLVRNQAIIKRLVIMRETVAKMNHFGRKGSCCRMKRMATTVYAPNDL